MIEDEIAGFRNTALDIDVREKGMDIGNDAVGITALDHGLALIRISNKGV